MKSVVRKYNIIGFSIVIIAILIGIVCSNLLVQSFDPAMEQAIAVSCNNYAKDFNDSFEKLQTTTDTIGNHISYEFDSVDDVKSVETRNDIEDTIKKISKKTLPEINGGKTVFFRFAPEITTDTAGFYMEYDGVSVYDIPVTDFSAYDRNNYEKLGWYNIPVNKGEAVWIDSYQIENTRDYKIAYVIPIYVEDTIIGVYGFEVDMIYMQDEIEAIAEATDSYVCIRDHTGSRLTELCAGTLYEKSFHVESRLENGMIFSIDIPNKVLYKNKYGRLFRTIITLYAILIMAVIFSVVSIGVKPLREKKKAKLGNVKYVYHALAGCMVAVLIVQILVLVVETTNTHLVEPEYIIAENNFDKTLNVVMDKDFEPFSFYDEDGNPAGYFVEAANEICNRNGYNINISLLDWDSCIEAVESGNADIAMGVESILSEYTCLKSQDIVYDSFVIYGKKPIETIMDVKNSKIAMIYGTIGNDSYGLQEKCTVYNSYESELASVVSGENDYAIVRKSIGDMLIYRNGYTGISQVYNLMESPMCVGVSGDQALLEKINISITGMKEDKTLDDIYKRWIQRYVDRSVEDVIIDNSECYIITTAIQILLIITFFAVKIFAARTNELIKKSETDALTKINNRGGGEQKIRDVMAKNIPGMFCLFDIDHFKYFNDTYGHAVGDKVLIAVANSMVKTFRDRDIIMRLGGDEFAVYATFVPGQEVGEKIIGRLFDDINRIEIPEIKDTKITISLGATFYEPDTEDSFDKAYNRADKKTYVSKTFEGNHFEFSQ